jgi:hypothetical protein
MALRITSSAFDNNGKIPSKYTCEGDDLSPPLEWSGVPEGTKSLVLIVDDPDAPDPAKPQRVYVHWVLYNIPAEATRIEENAWRSHLPDGTATGVNDWDKQAWGGPCPPIGRHRYFFKLYALDAPTGLRDGHTKAELLKAIEGHVLDQAELIGTYERNAK